MSMRLRLLGSPRLDAAEASRDLPLDRPASLGYLLAHRGDWVRRAELACLYNPEADESSALSNLRKLAHRLRQQGWAEGLEADTSRLRLRLPTDVHEFRAALQCRDWAQALQLYRGAFLEGLAFPDLAGYDDWLALERQDLARAWRTALLEQVRTLDGQGDWIQAERWLEKLMRTDPLDEEAAQQWMRILLAAGQPSRAGEVYEHLRRCLSDELGVEPMEATRVLADTLRSAQVDIHRAAPPGPVAPGAEAPPREAAGAAGPAGSPRARHNLPAASSRFVGRAQELAGLSRHLANPHCRLLTVVGLGGMGKTRLALEAAGRQVEAFADGVWLVPLAEISRADLLVPNVAAAVGLVFSGPADPGLQLLNYLRGKQALLLLDNFEHLLEGRPLLEEWLALAPGLKLLVTSRVALETASEWLHDLDGLPFPTDDGADDLEAFDAVQLFIGRAERFSSRFAVTPGVLREVAELTRRVEGMPLALELAATWVRGLTVGEILVRLRQGLGLLESSGLGVPDRQRNLQAILAYAWQMLSADEQSALARLAVFRGGFELEAAQQVAGAHLGLLLRLINQALVRRAEDGRYDLHELVRQFAAGHLAGEVHAEAMARFCDHFQRQLLALAQAVRGDIQPDTVDRCRREFGNLITALDHLAATGQAQRLAETLVSFYALVEIAGLYKIGIGQIDALDASLEAQGCHDERLRAGLQAIKAYFLVKIGEDEQAVALAESAIARLEPGPPSEFLGIACGAVGICHHFGGRFEAAEAWYGRALAVMEQVGNRSEQCRMLNRLGTTMSQLDRYDDSNRLYAKALEIATAIGDLSEKANLLNNHGINFESTGQVEDAIRMYQASLEISERIRFMRVKSAALTNLGHVHERRGEYAQARRYYEQSLDIKRVLGEPVAIAISLTNLADVLYALGEDAQGHRVNLQAMEGTLAANARLYTARALWSFCKYFLKSGQSERALLLACFLSRTPERETWVRDEADAMIAGQAPALGAPTLARLQHQAGGMDCAAVAAWVKRQPGLPQDAAGAG